MVRARSAAEMPVVTPSAASIETVKAVPYGVLLSRRHLRQAELPAALLGQRQADQAAAMLGHEVDRLRRHVFGRHDEVALVLAVFFVDQDDHAASLQFGDDLGGGGDGGVGRHASPGGEKGSDIFAETRRPHMTLAVRSGRSGRIGLDLDAQADLVADERQARQHAVLRAPQGALGIGAAAALADHQVEPALEARNLETHRPRLAEQGQGALDGHRPAVPEYETLAAEADVGMVLDVEPLAAPEHGVAQVETGVERRRVDADVRRRRFRVSSSKRSVPVVALKRPCWVEKPKWSIAKLA